MILAELGVFSLAFCFVKLLHHIYIKSNKQNKAQSQANKIISQALLFSATLNSLQINLAYAHRTEKPSTKSRHHPRQSVCLVSAARESCSRMRLCSRSWILLAWSNWIYSAIQKSLATPHFFCFQGTRFSYNNVISESGIDCSPDHLQEIFFVCLLSHFILTWIIQV